MTPIYSWSWTWVGSHEPFSQQHRKVRVRLETGALRLKARVRANIRPLSFGRQRESTITRDQQARPDNRTDNPLKSARPPSPVQIRPAPPFQIVSDQRLRNGAVRHADRLSRIVARSSRWRSKEPPPCMVQGAASIGTTAGEPIITGRRWCERGAQFLPLAPEANLASLSTRDGRQRASALLVKRHLLAT